MRPPAQDSDPSAGPRQTPDLNIRHPSSAADREARKAGIHHAQHVSSERLPGVPNRLGSVLAFPTLAPAQAMTSQTGQHMRPNSTSLASTLPSPSLTNESSPASLSTHGDFPGRPAGMAAEPEQIPASNSGTSAISTTSKWAAATSHQHQPESLQQRSSQAGADYQHERVPQSGPRRILPVDSSQPRLVHAPESDTAGNSEHRRKRSRHDHEHPSHTQIALQQACLLIDERVARFNDCNAAEFSIERARYRVLRSACSMGDLFYIVLHRYFCLWSRDRPQAHAVFPVGPELIDFTFQVMLGVLRNNEDMAESHLIWLSGFPDFLTQVPDFGNTCLQVADFLARFAVKWPGLLSEIRLRMYPLLSWEVRALLGCISPELATILFTLSRRHLCVTDGPIAQAMGELFKRDQIKELQMADRGATQEALRVSRDDLTVRLKTLLVKARRRVSQPITTPTSASQVMSSTPTGSLVPQQQRHSVAHPNPNPVIQRPVDSQPGAAFRSQDNVPPQQICLVIPPSNMDPRFVLRSNQSLAPGHTIAQEPGHTPTSTSPFPTSQAWLPSLRYPSQLTSGSPSTYLPPVGSQRQATPQGLSLSRDWRNQHWNASRQTSPNPNTEPAMPSPNSQYLQQGVHGHQAQPTQPAMAVARNFAPYPHPPRSSPISGPPQGLQTQSAMSSPHSQYFQPRAHSYQAQQTQPVTVAARNFMPHSLPPQSSPVLGPPQQGPYTQAACLMQPPASQFTTHPVPENEYPSNPHDWTSVSCSLHLTHLRSPTRAPATPGITRFYQFFEKFVVEPKAIPLQLGLSTLEFSLDQENLSKIPETLTSSDLPISRYSDGSQRYRLRLCQRSQGQTTVDEATWAVCRSYWPEHIHINFNDHPKLLRRRRHFHHDLPIELTDSLVLGKNTVKVSLPDYASNMKQGTIYFMAVELINTLNHNSVWSLVQNIRHVSSDETRHQVQRRLMPSDSDDIIVENDTIIVTVADPFSSQLFVCPVRGSNCKHLECIDLKNWLETRPSKPPRGSTEPTMIDVWNCPICGMDARPLNLRIDDFFVEVRNKLLADGNGNVKKIEISANGNWVPVEEPDEVEEVVPASAKVETMSLAGRDSTVPAAPQEIIILDDD